MVEYRVVPGFSHYRVGDDGSLWTRVIMGSIKHGEKRRHGNWRRLSTKSRDRDGYVRIALYPDTGNRAYRGLHKLILESFVGPAPHHGMIPLHNNGVHDDNRPENLRWGTHEENCSDREKHGNGVKGSKNPNAKLTEADVLEIRRRAAAGESRATISAEFGLKHRYISKILCRTVWVEI